MTIWPLSTTTWSFTIWSKTYNNHCIPFALVQACQYTYFVYIWLENLHMSRSQLLYIGCLGCDKRKWWLHGPKLVEGDPFEGYDQWMEKFSFKLQNKGHVMGPLCWGKVTGIHRIFHSQLENLLYIYVFLLFSEHIWSPSVWKYANKF